MVKIGQNNDSVFSVYLITALMNDSLFQHWQEGLNILALIASVAFVVLTSAAPHFSIK